MMNKTECEKALENAVDAGIFVTDWRVLDNLIKEHFKLVERCNKLEKALDKICQFNEDNYVVFEEKYICGHDFSETLTFGEWKEWCLSNEL